MKNFINKFALVILLISFAAVQNGFSKNPEYKLSLENVKIVSPNVMEFDIYLQHTNSKDSKFDYVMGQYFFDFNPEIANGGTLTYSIVSSDLPAELQPKNPTVSGNQLRLATNIVPETRNVVAVSDKSPGTLIAKMRLETSAKEFSKAPVNLRMRTGPENPYTKVAAFTDNKVVDVTVPSEVAADNISGESITNAIPTVFALNQNYPNPFNPATKIKFDIPQTANVELKVYDITGREIASLVSSVLDPGSYEYQFNGSNFASGIYFFRMKAIDASSNKESFVQTRKMLLIK